jgi:hypothetical protein
MGITTFKCPDCGRRQAHMFYSICTTCSACGALAIVEEDDDECEGDKADGCDLKKEIDNPK